MKLRSKAPFQYSDLEIEIGEGKSNLGKIKSRRITVDQLGEMLSNPVRDNVTHAQYLKFPKEEQDRRKNMGFWLGGPSIDGRRKNVSLKSRSVVTLDLDDAVSSLVDALLNGRTRLNKYSFFVHSTRKHTEENPRLRVVILLEEPVAIDEYAPLARIVANELDDTMDQIDDVSFRPAQMMYKPTVSSDGDFIFFQNEGELMNGKAVLEAWGDWKDWRKLPFSEKQGAKRPVDPNRKAEHPHTKKGIIGAFCRTYSIEDAIEKFLPDIYVPGDAESGKPRYTYTGGSTTNGAVVEDDGLFLYSHHSTDPCTDRLVNAFDMVRLHLFGEADEGKDPNDTKPVDMPSYKSMIAYLEEDEDTKRELQASNYDYSTMFEDLGEAEPPARSKPSAKQDKEELEAGANVEDVAAAFENLDADEEDLDDDILDLIGPAPKAEVAKYDSSWLQDLELTPKGFIKSNLPNVAAIVQNDPRIVGTVALNLFTNEIVTRRDLVTKMKTMSSQPIRDKVNGDLWSDYHDNALRLLLEAPNGPKKPGYGLKVSDRDLEAAVMMAAQKAAFHPVRDYLNSVSPTWDRKARIETVFIRFLGAPDTPYVREVSLKFFIAAVARIFEPGHKFDFMVILEGMQGKRKSTFIKILARMWFAELEGDMHDRRRLVEQMQGAWILEPAELSGMGRSEINAVKAFISASSDKVRLAYARRAFDFKRQCVFIGTTNEGQYLQDDTGNRRFWMIHTEVDEIDTDGLEREVNQLWAEAVHMYFEMRAKHPHGDLPLYLTSREAQEHARNLQESRRVQTEIDAYAGMIENWLNTPVDLERINGVAGKFDNLDGKPTPKILRSVVCLPEVWTECLANDFRHYKRSDAVALGRAMRRIPGWQVSEKPARTKRYGLQKVWRRIADSAPGDDDLIG